MLHEPDRLYCEETECVEHVIFEDLAAGAVALVEEFGSGYGGLGSFGDGVEGHEFADQCARVGIAFEGGSGVRKLGGFEEES